MEWTGIGPTRLYRDGELILEPFPAHDIHNTSPMRGHAYGSTAAPRPPRISP